MPIRKRLFRRKYYARIFCILLLATLLPSYATALYFYRDYASSIVERAGNNNRNMLEYVGGTLDKIAGEMRRTAYDSPLRKEITWFASNEFFHDPVGFEKLSKNLYLLIENSEYIDSIYVYFENFGYLLESHAGTGTSYVKIERLGDSGWQKDYEAGSFHHLYTRPAPETAHGYLTLLCPILDSTSRRQGVVVVNVRAEQVFRTVQPLRSEHSGNIYVVDGEGAVLLADAPLPGISLPAALPAEQGATGSGRERMAVYFTDSLETGWSVCSVTPYQLMVGDFSFTSFAKIVLLAVLAISLVLAVFTSRYLYTPLQRLIKRIAAGTELEGIDEFQLIDRVYHNMAETAENLENRAVRGETAILEKALRRGVLYHEAPPPILQEKLAKLGAGREGRETLALAVLAPDYMGAPEDMASAADSWGIVFILQLAKELLEVYGIPGLVFETSDGVVVLTVLEEAAENRYALLQEYLTELKNMAAQHLPYTVSVGVGGSISGWEQAGNAYSQCLAALSYRISRGCNQIFFYGMESGGRNVLLNLTAYCARMETMLRLRNRQEIAGCLDELTEEINSQPDLTPNQVINAYLYLLFFAFHTLLALDRNVYHTLLRETEVGELMNCGSQAACSQWMLDFFERCFLALGTPDAPISPLNRKIRNAQAYIQAHYSEDIALTTVSGEIGLNSTYFSTMFKEETGKSFSQYLQAIRIEKSKELLRTTGETLQTIAVQVGLNSEKSFIRLFKKLNGCTPGQYRSSVREEPAGKK